MKAYYDRRAPEYDDWWLGVGLYADRDRPDVLDPEIVSGQADRSRLSHRAASLALCFGVPEQLQLEDMRRVEAVDAQ